MGTGAAAVRRTDVPPPVEAFRPPSLRRASLRASLPCLVPLFLWAVGAIPAVHAILTGTVLAVIAGARVGYVRFDLWRCRQAADRLLLAERCGGELSALAVWRSAELTSGRQRRHLAGWLRDMIGDAEHPRRGWTPLNRNAALQNLFLLRQLEAVLGDVSRPVSAHGVLVLRELLADGATSPLYRSDRSEELPDVLAGALADLDAPR